MHGHGRLIPILGAVVAIAVVAVLAVTGVIGGHSRSAPPTNYGFDSPYELHWAESEVDELVLRKEEGTEGTGLSEETLINSTNCVLSSPPPTAHSLVCSVLVGTHVLYRNGKATRLNRWKVRVSVNPKNGGLSLRATKANTEA